MLNMMTWRDREETKVIISNHHDLTNQRTEVDLVTRSRGPPGTSVDHGTHTSDGHCVSPLGNFTKENHLEEGWWKMERQTGWQLDEYHLAVDRTRQTNLDTAS